MSRYKYLKWFWGLIVLGALLPIITGLSIEIIFDSKDFPNSFKLFLSSFISPGSLLILLWNDVPFIIYAFMIRSLCHRPETENYQNFYKHKSGVIGAGILTIGFVLYVNIGVWRGIALHQSGSSTSVIAYVFLPIYGVATILIGYGTGRLIGKLVLMYKNSPQKR